MQIGLSVGEFLVTGKRRINVKQKERVIWEAFSSILKFSVLLSYLTTSMYSFERELKLKLIFFKNLKFVLK